MSNMKAARLIHQRHILSGDIFVEMVVWDVPKALKGSHHHFKYRLALVVDEICVLRYDNELGKGDHKHIDGREIAYQFTDAQRLLKDFWRDVSNWRRDNE